MFIPTKQIHKTTVIKDFDDGEVNKQSVTKIDLLFSEIDVIAFKQFPLVGTSLYLNILCPYQLQRNAGKKTSRSSRN
jgi:hypothetical protein